jgi:Fe-S cluster assembly ATPase SufC
MMFGAYAAGRANQYGPDMGKAKEAGTTIFSCIETPSKINAVDIPDEAIHINPKTFRGEIELRNVWFRYPTRKDEWVFKGLNLKINPNESVAVVGESGCGKSTLVSLILRFYDPNEGQVLIDGVDIKKYNLRDLRMRMGFVMQEPTLFNCSIKENILYGHSFAKDSEIKEAASAANACAFIDDGAITNSFEDSAPVLYKAFVEREAIIAEKKGREYYDKTLKKLEHLVQKEEQEGRFVAVKGEMDERDSSCNDVPLSSGYDVECGLKGGKLSGG